MKTKLTRRMTLAALLLISIAGFSATITSKVGITGNWSDTATWIGSIVPVVGDDVIISSGATITVTGSSACNTLTFATGTTANATVQLQSSALLSITGLVLFNTPGADNVTNLLNADSASLICGSVRMASSAAGANRFTRLLISTGSVVVNGIYDQTDNNNTTRRITEITSTGTLNIKGNCYARGTFLLNAASTVAYTGNANQNIFGNTEGIANYPNLTIGGGSAKTPMSNFGINGKLTLDSAVLRLGQFTVTLNNGGTIIEGSPYSNTNMIETNTYTSFVRMSNTLAGYKMTYPVGAGGIYTPLVIDTMAATVAVGSQIAIKVSPDKHLFISDTSYLKRYWTVATTGLTNINIATAYFLYDNTDIEGAESSINTVGVLQSAAWNTTVTGATVDAAQNRISLSNTGIIALTGQWTAAKSTVFNIPAGKFSVTNGAWGTGSTWNGGTVPAMGSDVYILHDVTRDGVYTVNNINVAAGGRLQTGNNTTRRITVNGAFYLAGYYYDERDGGIDSLKGKLTITPTGNWASGSVATAANMVFCAGIENNGVFNAGGAVFGLNDQVLYGTNGLNFSGPVIIYMNIITRTTITSGGTVTLGNDITFTNKSTVSIAGTLNGSNANSTWLNDTNSTLNYSSGTNIMAIGNLTATSQGNTVHYNRNNTQTIKMVPYWHLTVSAGNTKTFATNTDLTVYGNLTIASGTTLTAQNAGYDTLTIYGILSNSGTLTLRRAINQYFDLVMKGQGDIITGNGVYTLRTLTMDNANAKSSSNTSAITLNPGIDSVLAFYNYGGTFTTAGPVTFIGLNGSCKGYLGGSGEMILNGQLSVGNNNNNGLQTQMLGDLTAGNINFNVSGAGFLGVNGFSLVINGNLTSSAAGLIRGGAGSTITFAGTGTSTQGFVIDNSVIGTTNLFDSLIINRSIASSTVTIQSGNIIIDNLLAILSGNLVSTWNIRVNNDFINNDTINLTGTSTISFMKSGTVNLSGTNLFYNVTLGAATNVVNYPSNTLIRSNLDGSSPNSVWRNETLSQLTYQGGNMPMITGSFNVSAARNTVYYLNTAADQTIKNTTYWDVIFEGPNSGANSRYKNLNGSITVNGNMTIRRNTAAGGTGNTYVRYNTGFAHAIDIAGDLILETANCILQVQNTGAVGHTLSVAGRIRNNGVVEMHPNANETEYGDVTISGSDTIISGTGTCRFRNLTLTASGTKYAVGNAIQLWWGQTAPARATFSNTGGAFIQLSGTFRLNSWNGVNNTVYLGLSGNAPITLNTLEYGGFADHNITCILGRDITVNGNLIFNTDNAAVFNLNGNTLTLNGDYAQGAETCKIRGSAASGLVINGTGKPTNSLLFDQTTPGTTNLLGRLTLNRGTDTVSLGNAVRIDSTLYLTSGVLNNTAFLTMNNMSTISRSNGALMALQSMPGMINVEYTSALNTGIELPLATNKLYNLIIKAGGVNTVDFAANQPTVNNYLDYYSGEISVNTGNYIKMATGAKVRISDTIVQTIFPVGTTASTPLYITVNSLDDALLFELKDGVHPNKPATAMSYLNKYVTVSGASTVRDYDFLLNYQQSNVINNNEQQLKASLYTGGMWIQTNLADTLNNLVGDSAITVLGDLTAFSRPLNSDADLSNLITSVGGLTPPFTPATVVYYDTVAHIVDSIDITPTLSDIAATMTVNGTPAVSAAAVTLALNVFNNVETIVVTAEDGTTTKTYTVNVYRLPSTDASLSNLTITAGTLSPIFASGTLSYTDTVSNATDTIQVTPTVNQSGATVLVNGSSVVSGNASQPLALAIGTTAVTIQVTAQDGITTTTYTVNVYRPASNDASLSSLTINSGVLAPSFSSGTLSYTDTVLTSVNAVRVTPTANHSGATITVNGASVISGNQSGDIAVATGTTTITIVVTAENGTTNSTYTIAVYRPASSDASLSNLTVSSGTLLPLFASGTYNYVDTVVYAIDSIQVTSTVSNAGASIMVNSIPVASGIASPKLPLALGNNIITVEVRAEDAITVLTYTIQVYRSDFVNVSEVAAAEFSVYPVPAHGTVYVKAPANVTVSRLRLISNTAEVLSETNVTGTVITMDVSRFASGAYILQLLVNNEWISLRLIIE